MSQIRPVTKIRCIPYPYRWESEEGAIYQVNLIALQKDNLIVGMTDYHKYVGVRGGVKKMYHQDEDAVRRVCNFLTYVLFENYHKYNAKNLCEIPFEAAQNYLMEYAKTKGRTGKYPSMQSVVKERAAICHFMKNLGLKRLDSDEHYYAKKVQVSNKKGWKISSQRTSKTVWEYELEALYVENIKSNIIRDIPQKAIPIILRHVRMHAPELVLAVLLQLCAGLRAGEVVNVRRPDSKYGTGIRISMDFGEFTSFEIDLNKEYNLRSDGVYTGKIKKERFQKVYPIFLQIIQEAYTEHMKLINKDLVEDTGPLFVNSSICNKTGKYMAISKQSYCNRIREIMYKYVLPDLLKANDTELQVYALAINENTWGLHAFRHWYTVQLVLNGETLEQIAFWRGDSSLQSSFVYLQNKGELMKIYERANDTVARTIMESVNSEEMKTEIKEIQEALKNKEEDRCN